MTKKYVIYKTTNIINNRYYVGIHSTTDISDSYLGSGKIIKEAIKKYGKENFKKEILYIFDTLEEALLKEKELVNEFFVKNPLTYNICLGGGIGGKNINGLTFQGRKHSKDSLEKIKEARRKNPPVISKKGIESIIKNNKENQERKNKISQTLTGRPKTEEFKANHCKVMKEYYKNNPSISKKRIPKPKIQCPYCKKIGSPNNMYRWHFDNCKFIGK